MNYQWGSIFSALPNVVLVNSRTHEVELGLTELESQHQFLSLSVCLSWLLSVPLLFLPPHLPSTFLTHLFTSALCWI